MFSKNTFIRNLAANGLNPTKLHAAAIDAITLHVTAESAYEREHAEYQLRYLELLTLLKIAESLDELACIKHQQELITNNGRQ